MDVFEALSRRRSVRGYERRPVPRSLLEEVFTAAQRAPSWCNIQPWRVVVTGASMTKTLSERLIAESQRVMPSPELPFPLDYPEPYKTHRKECGVALYQAMGVAREDGAGRHRAWLRNFEAFGAPHAAIVSMDKRFGLYAALDVGCWLQSFMLAATARGLSTCPQASLATYPGPVRELLSIPDGESIICGIAIGYENAAEPANACRTTRSPLSDNVRFVGWE